jgi:aldehyde:ferredoxin oxidoreductase
MDGWTGRILRVNLSQEKWEVQVLPPEILHSFLGGRGLGAYFLYTEVPPKSDPLGEDNILAFCNGPLTGTQVPSGGRSSLTILSPLTGTILDSNSGNEFGVRLKWAGYDALIIQGIACKPIWLKVSRGEVTFHPASDLWGKEVPQTVEALSQNDTAVICIGPAGENKVLFSSILDQHGRSYGRGGTGAVMGSKLLKAIAVIGKEKPSIAEKAALEFINYEARKVITATPRTSQGLPEFGTSVLVNLMNWYSVLPTENFQKRQFDAAESISGERLREEFLVKRSACWGCAIGCKRLTKTRNESGEGPEYETIFALGSDLGINNMEVVIEANYLCNRLGLDTISTGGTIACAMELAQHEKIDSELRFGRADMLLQTIKDIAYRRGLGDELALGSRRLAEKYSEPWVAMQVKGLEMPGYDPRGMQGQGLLYATSNRGACHLRGNMLGPELLGLPKMIDRFDSAGKAGLLIVMQHTNAVIDSIGMCKFVNFAIGDEYFARMISAITGLRYEIQDILLVGERIWNLERLYNLRAGFTKLDDTLPPRFLLEPQVEVVSKGLVVELDTMLGEYYRFRGWDSQGMPVLRKIKALGLETIAGDFIKEATHA